MARKCVICNHPKREDIEKAIVSQVKFREIANDFAISISAVYRHRRDHLPELLAKAAQLKPTKSMAIPDA